MRILRRCIFTATLLLAPLSAALADVDLGDDHELAGEVDSLKSGVEWPTEDCRAKYPGPVAPRKLKPRQCIYSQCFAKSNRYGRELQKLEAIRRLLALLRLNPEDLCTQTTSGESSSCPGTKSCLPNGLRSYGNGSLDVEKHGGCHVGLDTDGDGAPDKWVAGEYYKVCGEHDPTNQGKPRINASTCSCTTDSGDPDLIRW